MYAYAVLDTENLASVFISCFATKLFAKIMKQKYLTTAALKMSRRAIKCEENYAIHAGM
jgi:hypothetical protein